MKRCTLCSAPISWTYWLCADCVKEHNLEGIDFKDWPEWIKALVSIDRREAYLQTKMTIIYTDDLEELLKYHPDAKVL